MGVRCFLLVQAPFVERSLRRYASNSACTGAMSYHNAEALVERFAMPVPDDGEAEDCGLGIVPHGDPRWPKSCACGYEFQETDVWQVNDHRLHSGHPSGELYSVRAAPPGAMWWAYWFGGDGTPNYEWDNATEPPLVCRLPNGSEWNIDSRCSNCGLPEDRLHRCWVRHGVPPDITVDKCGVTCPAGGGSIQSGDWHGYLRGGELTQ